jgi:DNA-binding MarR family transcriptional regulator
MPDRAVITAADIDAVVGWTVIRAARRAARLLALTLKDHELTPVEFGVLAQLAAARGELTQAEVARAVEVRPQSVAPVIDGLSARGLLRREGARGRGRSGRLVLSDSGAALLEAAFPDVLATNPAFARPETAQSGPVNEALLYFLAQNDHVEPT